MKKQTKLSLVEVFRNLIKKQTGNHFAIYYTLFRLKTDESIQQELAYYYKEAKKDPEWFFYFHKSIRQADYFENCTIERLYSLITQKEEKRFREIRRKTLDEKVLYQKNVKLTTQASLMNTGNTWTSINAAAGR